MSKCKCNFAQKMVGDGCDECNTGYVESLTTPKQRLIEVLQNELRSRQILDDIDIGYEQGTKRALELIKEILPDP